MALAQYNRPRISLSALWQDCAAPTPVGTALADLANASGDLQPSARLTSETGRNDNLASGSP
jgi:hypothetical protein